MTDLKKAILDAKYIDMIALGDFVVRDCGLPDTDAEGNLLPQANEIAAAIFRWATDVQAMEDAEVKSKPAPAAVAAAVAEEVSATGRTGNERVGDYDEFGDPVMDAEQAERLEAAREAVKEESA